MTINDRFRLPMDIIDRVIELNSRLRTLERLPRFPSTAIDNGALVIKNENVSITVEDTTGNPVITLKFSSDYVEPTLPIFRFKPTGPASVDSIVIVNSDFFANNEHQSTAQMHYSSSNTNRAGRFVIQTLALTVDWLPGVSETNSFMQVAGTGNFPLSGSGNIYFNGTWLNNNPASVDDAICAGTQNVSAGVGSVTINYPLTFASTIVPIVGLHSAAGAVDWCLTAQSTASFTVAWSDLTAKIINWWSIRL